jgi:hypothetical protein
MVNMYLPLDVVHGIVDALTVPSIDSNEPGSSKTSTLCAASWISKHFASLTRSHLFQDISINSEARCSSLLTLLEKNPSLQTCITYLVLASSSDLKCPLPNSHTDPSNSWIVSPMTSELMNKLHRLSRMTFLNITLSGEMVDSMITHTLRSRQKDITRLNITSCKSISLHELDRLIMYLPALETISLDGSTSCLVSSSEGDRNHTTIQDTKQHPLRQMNLHLRGIEIMTELPTWFTSRTYLSSMKELDLACWHTMTLSASAWDMIIATSSSLTHLTLRETLPVDNDPVFFTRFEMLAAPALINLRLVAADGNLDQVAVDGSLSTMAWMVTVLSSIAPCTTMRKLEIYNVKQWKSDGCDWTVAWRLIDDILTRAFPHLQHAHIEMEWEIYHSDRVPEEEVIRLAMPGLDKMGNLELRLSVTIEDEDYEDSDSYNGFGLSD